MNGDKSKYQQDIGTNLLKRKRDFKISWGGRELNQVKDLRLFGMEDDWRDICCWCTKKDWIGSWCDEETYYERLQTYWKVLIWKCIWAWYLAGTASILLCNTEIWTLTASLETRHWSGLLETHQGSSSRDHIRKQDIKDSVCITWGVVQKVAITAHLNVRNSTETEEQSRATEDIVEYNKG